MTGYASKRAAAQDKLEDDDTQIYQTELTKLLMESYDRGVADALEETKAALAQPAQEPVAWRYRGNLHEFDPSDWATGPVTPLYTTPPQRPWVGLTEEDLKPLCAKWRIVYGGWTEDFARDIEAELKEKNNAA